MKIMKLMNMMKRPLSLIQWLIIMKFCILTQWMMMPKRKIKSVKIPEISLKFRQMSQNISRMEKRIKSEAKSHIKNNLKISQIK